MHVQSILTIDVGNSRTKFGLFARPRASETSGTLPPCRCMLSVAHADPLPWAQLAAWLPLPQRQAARTIVAGVKPAGVERLLAEWPAEEWPRPQVIRSARELPVEVRLAAPDKVGIDRLLNVAAVNVIRPAATAAIVIDSGTATTVDLVSDDGAFVGGAILPGLELCARSLHQYTAFLPLVAVDELTGSPLPAVGADTRGAIRSGLLYGQVGAINELVARLSSRLSTPPLVVLTGGAATILARFLPPEVRLERELTLQGLALTSGATEIADRRSNGS